MPWFCSACAASSTRSTSAGAIAVLAFRDEVLGEGEIIEDAVRVGPLLEDVVVLEEVVVAEGGVRHHQRLHGRRVLFQKIDDARVRIDDDFVGEALPALAVEGLVAHELLAERPMAVEQRHAGRGIGVEHLLGGYHLDPGLVDVEPKLAMADSPQRHHRSWQGCRSSNRRPRTEACLRLRLARHQAPTDAALFSARRVPGIQGRCRAGREPCAWPSGVPATGSDRRRAKACSAALSPRRRSSGSRPTSM